MSKKKTAKEIADDLISHYYGFDKAIKHNGLETPGGDSAIDKGCTCPVLDNNHGRGLGNGHFWMDANCPIHGANSPI